ncbi:MAG: 4Fe-4S dicluster domain-containing protein, partial [Clostridia bacterium]|nr:4Fe-4S dicluster domain-containing protein [Clostridia bacterium]
DVVLSKCAVCNKTHQVKDEEIILHERPERDVDRFAEVAKLEAMTEEERFAFWREQLSKCIRCNACRNVCPACSCVKCVFDNPASGIAAKANDDTFEEQMFHIIRAFHVAGRCTDCGECSRVCPQNIPLHLLNRKFIKDIDGLYGEYQAGETADGKTPLTSYKEEDAEPNDVLNGEAK